MNTEITGTEKSSIHSVLNKLKGTLTNPLDIFPHESLPEKILDLQVRGIPPGIHPKMKQELSELLRELNLCSTEDLRVLVFGGGTGLSTILGGDSRSDLWVESPFEGLKEIFPKTRAIVCTSDDGGSTGELLKDLPLIALGDIRHVLLASIQKNRLQLEYSLSEKEVKKTIGVLHALFNYRISEPPSSAASLLKSAGVSLKDLPFDMGKSLAKFISGIFQDQNQKPLLLRRHCLGNLILVRAIFDQLKKTRWQSGQKIPQAAIHKALDALGSLIGANFQAVIPASTTPAQLQVLYTNGVLVSGEYKSGTAKRKFPVDRVFVRFFSKTKASERVLKAIRNAEIILYAPGSLYSSIIPIFQTPGVVEEVRKNKSALKIFIANLWVQKGETDGVAKDPARSFHVSDLLTAYNRNIPGGMEDLFKLVLVLGLKGIPGSILQRYAIENKIPIYLDREKVEHLGFVPIEAGIYCEKTLQERQVIKHDPNIVANAIHTIWAVRKEWNPNNQRTLKCLSESYHRFLIPRKDQVPCQRFIGIKQCLHERIKGSNKDKKRILPAMIDILWEHADITPKHLSYSKGIQLIDHSTWERCQKWDNLFSFFDPKDGFIKIRADELENKSTLEVAMLTAIGQSLLGNYIEKKEMNPIIQNEEILGNLFQITLRPWPTIQSFFTRVELDRYLQLARMVPSKRNKSLYTRVLNSKEGFTPPGLLFGLTYAWYLDNRLASHIEYKMAILRNELSDLIPEQTRLYHQRKAMIEFFREVVFRHRVVSD